MPSPGTVQKVRATGGYLLVFLLQFGSLGCIWSLVFGRLCSPHLAKLLSDVTNGYARVVFFDLGSVIRAEHKESRAAVIQMG